MIDRSLDRLLTAAASDTQYPRTPDLAARVLAAVTEPARTPSKRLALPRPAFALTLALLAAVVVAALVIAPSREAIARFFGVEGSRIEFLPTPAPGTTPTPFPTAGATIPPNGVESTVALADIPARAGFEPALPEVPDARLRSTIIFYAGQPVVTHHYARFDLWQTQLRQDAGFGKGIPEGGVVEELMVGDVPGVWLTGAPHYVYYYTDTGYVVPNSQREIERSTLIWRTDAFFYRIETDLPLQDALRIAETLP